MWAARRESEAEEVRACLLHEVREACARHVDLRDHLRRTRRVHRRIDRAVGDDLVGVHVRLCAGTRLPYAKREVVVERARRFHEMRRRDAKSGIATLCVSGGMGMAVLFER